MTDFAFAPKKSWHKPIKEPTSKYPLVCSIMVRGVFVDFPARLTPKTLVLIDTSGTFAEKCTFYREADPYGEGRLRPRGTGRGYVVRLQSEDLGPNTSTELRILLEGLGAAHSEQQRRSGLRRAAKGRLRKLEPAAVEAATELLNAIASGGEVDLESLAEEFRVRALAVASIGFLNENAPVESARVRVSDLYIYGPAQ